MATRTLSRRAIREQHRPRLRVQRRDVAYAIVLFVGARELVAADAVLLVSAYRSDEGDAGLRAAVHDHAIDVKSRLRVADQDALRDQPLEAPCALRVRLVGVRRAAFGQIDLGP